MKTSGRNAVLVTLSLLLLLLSACQLKDGYSARLYVRSPSLARSDGWLTLREPLTDANNSWIIRAVDFRGTDSLLFTVVTPTIARLAATVKSQKLDLGLYGPGGQILVLTMADPQKAASYISSQELAPGEYRLEYRAARKVSEFNIVLQLDN
ncbi:MAG: hypothetical protein KKI09_07140 [Spirochaetes bacterium]|nr:hypothetical protein [Spirochaetota bacterium]MBU0955185.1 hypothetical protein [Spirochaetota bacterium]